jgi:hypothetical protein
MTLFLAIFMLVTPVRKKAYLHERAERMQRKVEAAGKASDKLNSIKYYDR